MRIFLAMIVTPSLALALQSLLYSLVTPSCAHQSRLWIHGSAALGGTKTPTPWRPAGRNQGESARAISDDR